MIRFPHDILSSNKATGSWLLFWMFGIGAFSLEALPDNLNFLQYVTPSVETP
jgi:hypothetical protein